MVNNWLATKHIMEQASSALYYLPNPVKVCDHCQMVQVNFDSDVCYECRDLLGLSSSRPLVLGGQSFADDEDPFLPGGAEYDPDLDSFESIEPDDVEIEWSGKGDGLGFAVNRVTGEGYIVVRDLPKAPENDTGAP